jgi:hypothetical protein
LQDRNLLPNVEAVCFGLENRHWSYGIFGGTVLCQLGLLIAGSYWAMTDPTSRCSFLLPASLFPGHFMFSVIGLVMYRVTLKAGNNSWDVFALTVRAWFTTFTTLAFLVAGLANPSPTLNLACYASGCCGLALIFAKPWSKLGAFLASAVRKFRRKTGVLFDTHRQGSLTAASTADLVPASRSLSTTR